MERKSITFNFCAGWALVVGGNTTTKFYIKRLRFQKELKFQRQTNAIAAPSMKNEIHNPSRKRRRQEPLETRQTIVGGSAIDCEPIASRLAECLESLSVDGELAEALKNGHLSDPGVCQLEVELRLGTLENVRDGAPLDLPVATDALIANKFPLKFVAAVVCDDFKSVDALLQRSVQPPTVSTSPTSAGVSSNAAAAPWDMSLNNESVDFFFNLPEYKESVRISQKVSNAALANGHGGGSSLSAIRKVRLITWNVYSARKHLGSDSDADADSYGYGENDNLYINEVHGSNDTSGRIQRLDYRIAINLEYRVPLTEPPPTSQATLTRKRRRSTFKHLPSGLVFDITKVNAEDPNSTLAATPNKNSATRSIKKDDGDDDKATYEIEIELDNEMLLKAFKIENAEERLNTLKYHCATLTRAGKFIRDHVCAEKLNKVTGGDVLVLGKSVTGASEFLSKLPLCDLVLVQQSAEAVKRYQKRVSTQLPLIGDYLFRGIDETCKRLAENARGYSENTDEIDGPYFCKMDSSGQYTIVVGRDNNRSK